MILNTGAMQCFALETGSAFLLLQQTLPWEVGGLCVG